MEIAARIINPFLVAPEQRNDKTREMIPNGEFASAPSVRLTVDLSLFPETAVLKTSYWLSKSYFISLRHISTSQVEIEMHLKANSKPLESPEQIFTERLLDETLRESIAKRTEPLRNLIIAHALSKTPLAQD